MTPEQALKRLDETVIGDWEWKIALSKALEKQIAKKPIPIMGRYTRRIISFMCPNSDCNAEDLGNNEYCVNVCECCGQKLDWGGL